MKLRLLISLSFLALASRTIRAQSADDFFHGGAQLYLTNNVQNALKETEAGLNRYPDDVKLKTLYELLKQQQESQSQSQQNKQQQNQKNQSSQSDENKNSREQKAQNQSQQQPQNQQEKQQQAETGGQQKQQGNSGEQANANAAHANGEMSPQEAERLLDAHKENEKMLPFKPVQPQSPKARPIRDW